MFKTIFLLFFLLLSIGLISAQDDFFEFGADASVVIEHGSRGDWDSRFTGPGAVVYHDGLFHMFRNGYQRWLLPSGIGYLTSEDGITWEEVQEEPIFTHEQIPFENIDMVLVNSVLVRDDGTWVFYFSLVPDEEEGQPGIFMATADDPLAEWTVHEPLLVTSDEARDAGAIGTVEVIQWNGAYKMYYAAQNADGLFTIRLATSSDGLTWKHHPEPILVQTDEVWEENVNDPRITVVDEQLVMLYSSHNQEVIGYGLARSTDGITWEKLDSNPILENRAVSGKTWYPEFVYQDERYYFYLELERPIGSTNIYVATYGGTLE